MGMRLGPQAYREGLFADGVVRERVDAALVPGGSSKLLLGQDQMWN